MIEVRPHADGCVISVRAQPGARRSGIQGEQAGALKVAVTAPADKGRANEALVEALAEAFELKKSQIEIISGQSSRQKKVFVRLEVAQMRRRLAEILAEG